MKQIVIKISSDGVIQAETQNMKGHECQKYLKEIEELTSAVSVESRYKPEFYSEGILSQSEVATEESQKAVSDNIKL